MSIHKIIYRCQKNNGVATFLTPDAYQALCDRKVYAEVHGIFPRSPELFNKIMAGTFTIVHKEKWGYFAGYAAGTYEDLDRWLKAGDVVLLEGESGNLVPFSNNDFEDEAHYVQPDEAIAAAFFIDLSEVRLPGAQSRGDGDISIN